MRKYTLLLLFGLFNHSSFSQSDYSDDLIVTPERSNYSKTSTYAEVVSFLEAIKKQSSNVHVFSMGKSLEGKDIPVAVLANQLIKTHQEAKASGKLVVYIQGNIHAGEVEGKESVMLLMRDILLGDQKHLLDSLIVLLAPIYNTDSNDKMEKGGRPSQEDSPLEAGLRENSQGLDLNRDGMKMEALETNGLFKNVITTWDPQLFVDLHTTNGTWHGYALTWAPSYHSSGAYGPYDFTSNTMLPAITMKAKENGLLFGPFGDFSLREGWPVKNFYTYNHHPRYLVNQFGLRNRMAILSEAFAHDRFYKRINSTHFFITEILNYAHLHAAQILRIIRKAEEESIQSILTKAGKEKKGVAFTMVPLGPIKNFLSYEYISSAQPDGSKIFIRTGNIATLDSVTYFAKFEPELFSTIPRGYVIPASYKSIVDNLTAHGIVVTTLTKTTSFSGEVFQVEKHDKASRSFQGHAMVKLDGQWVPAKQKFKKGDYIVDAAQPLANLIFYLLEPQSDDGLATWNFFDTYLEKENISNQPVNFPVFKYY